MASHDSLTTSDGGVADAGSGSSMNDMASTDPPGWVDAFISAKGTNLYLGDQRFRFVGANRYDLNSYPPSAGKFYCGSSYTDEQLDGLLFELATSTKATVVRTSAFQSFTLGGTDFSPIDRVLTIAKKYGMRVVFVLENQWKDCTQVDPDSTFANYNDPFYKDAKDADWYATRYLSPTGSYPKSYAQYVEDFVKKYKDDKRIAMWQLMNEAESSRLVGTQKVADSGALETFALDMVRRVKAIDQNHLLSLGTVGIGNLGLTPASYQYLHSINGIDIVEAHDYNHETMAMPPLIQSDLNVALNLNKPFFIGEAGIQVGPGAFTAIQRAAYMDAKIAAQWQGGSSGFLVWSWWDSLSGDMEQFDFNSMDPLASVLAKYAQ